MTHVRGETDLFLTAGSGIGTSLLVRSIPATAPESGEAQAAEHMHDGNRSPPARNSSSQRSVALRIVRTTLRLQYAYKDIGGYRLFIRTYDRA